MAKAMEKRDENIGAVEGDFADVTETKAKIGDHAETIATLTSEIAELYKSLNEATALREAESAENAKTVKDATAGLKAVRAATQVLKDFYEKSALIQTGRFVPEGADASGKTVGDLAPKVITSDYEGGKDQASGIIGLMEVITSDFEGTIEETNSQETKASEDYTAFKEETESTISEKKDSMRTNKGEMSDEKANLVSAQDNLKAHSDLKTEALGELEKLKPACVSTGSSYKERVARREQEIESLKNAYNILDDMG